VTQENAVLPSAVRRTSDLNSSPGKSSTGAKHLSLHPATASRRSSPLVPVVRALASVENRCVALGLHILAERLSAVRQEAVLLRIRDELGEQYHPKRMFRSDDVS
jgi:hypothetical protein